MSLSIRPQTAPTGAFVVEETDANNIAQNNVVARAGEMTMVQIDNSANPIEVVYLKVYDHLNPVVNVTPPDWIFRAQGGQVINYVMPIESEFTVGLSFACVTSGGTSGNVSPSNPVAIRIVGK